MLVAVGGLALLLAVYAHWRFGQFDERIDRVRGQVDRAARRHRIGSASQIGALGTQLEPVEHAGAGADPRAARGARAGGRTRPERRRTARAHRGAAARLGARRGAVPARTRRPAPAPRARRAHRDRRDGVRRRAARDGRRSGGGRGARAARARTRRAARRATYRTCRTCWRGSPRSRRALPTAACSACRSRRARRLETPAASPPELLDRATHRLAQAWRDLFSYRRVDPAHDAAGDARGRVAAPPALSNCCCSPRAIAAMQQDAAALPAVAAGGDAPGSTQFFDARDARGRGGAGGDRARCAASTSTRALPEVGAAAQLLQRVIRAARPRRHEGQPSSSPSALVGGGLLAHLVLDDPGYVADQRRPLAVRDDGARLRCCCSSACTSWRGRCVESLSARAPARAVARRATQAPRARRHAARAARPRRGPLAAAPKTC